MKNLNQLSKEEFISMFNAAKVGQDVVNHVSKEFDPSTGYNYVSCVGSFSDLSLLDKWFETDRNSVGYVFEIDAII